MPLQRRSRATTADRAEQRGRLAAVVLARRQELELTQSALAELAGVGRGPVVALEAGRPVSLDVLLALLDVLGVHLELVRGSTGREIRVGDELAARYDLPTRTRPAR